MLSAPMRLVNQDVRDFSILKSDDLIIGGYASIEMIDKQNDLITIKALEEAVDGFMVNKKFRWSWLRCFNSDCVKFNFSKKKR